MLDLSEFACQRCGACCRVPGYVLLAPDEVTAIAAYLCMDIYDFTRHYTRLVDNRQTLSLTEQEDGHCIFLLPDNTCRIQAVKPRQCRGYPYNWRCAMLDSKCAGLAVLRSQGTRN